MTIVRYMVMKQVGAAEFKAKCLAILAEVHKTKTPVQVTRRGKPIAEVNPPSASLVQDWMGSMKGKMEIVGDIIAPATDLEDWEVLRD
jgi:prevent-host-death family protein